MKIITSPHEAYTHEQTMPWYLHSALVGMEWDVRNDIFLKNGTSYYLLSQTQENFSKLQGVYEHLSGRMRMRLQSGLNSVYIDTRCTIISGRSNRDFLALLDRMEDESWEP